MATPLTVRVVEHQVQVFRRFWRGSYESIVRRYVRP